MKPGLPQIACCAVALALVACGASGASVVPNATPMPRITHVIVIFQENRTPDNLFHGLPGADIANSGVDSTGKTVPLAPVDLTAQYDIDHSHGAFLTEYNAGHMNGWDKVAFSCPKQSSCTPTAFGYVPPTEVTSYFELAEQYTFGDRMFQTNQGPSFPAHQYIIAGTSINAPGSTLLAAENPSYVANNLNCDGSQQSTVRMIDSAGTEGVLIQPCFEHPTLFDLLDAKGISWRYYDSYNGGLWSGPDAIGHIRRGSDWTNVISPQTSVLNDIVSGRLRAVSWVMPSAAQSDHARSTDGSGPAWVAAIVNAVGASPYWQNTAIIITWDDWGGWYDHVQPPMYNSYELGFRVPLIFVSAYARPANVSHVQHEFGSILHFIESTYDLPSLGYTDGRADDLSDCFDLHQTPIAFHTITSNRRAADFMDQAPSLAPPDDDF